VIGLAVGLWLSIAGCSDPVSEVVGESAALDLSAFEMVDLSHTYDQDTLYWPTSTERFEHTELAYGESDGGYFYSSYSFSSPEHGGTHMDAPIHFAEGGTTLDRLPLSQLVVPGVVVDVRDAAAQDPDYRLQLADLQAWEAQHGAVPAGSAVLLLTGWDRRWPDTLRYLGDDSPGDASSLHFPAFGEAAARFLVEERSVGLLGVDTASIDYGPSTDFMVHQIVNGAGVAALENFTGLDRLPPTGAWLIALPMKIGGGSGGPVRAIALLP